jgi:hypothetical protein
MKSAATFGLALVSLSLAACSSKRLPPGTPPPEYEQRPVAPWPSASLPAAAVPEVAEPPPAGPEAGAAGPDAGTDPGAAPAPAVDAGVGL